MPRGASTPVLRARLSPAWREQCVAIAALAMAAVGLNWVTTGNHLAKTLSQRYWPVAGLDIVLLLTAVIAMAAASRLRLRERAGSARRAAVDADEPTTEGGVARA